MYDVQLQWMLTPGQHIAKEFHFIIYKKHNETVTDFASSFKVKAEVSINYKKEIKTIILKFCSVSLISMRLCVFLWWPHQPLPTRKTKKKN